MKGKGRQMVWMSINDVLVMLQNAAFTDHEAEIVEVLACRAGFWKKCLKCLYVNQPTNVVCSDCKGKL